MLYVSHEYLFQSAVALTFNGISFYVLSIVTYYGSSLGSSTSTVSPSSSPESSTYTSTLGVSPTSAYFFPFCFFAAYYAISSCSFLILSSSYLFLLFYRYYFSEMTLVTVSSEFQLSKASVFYSIRFVLSYTTC